LLFLIYTRQDEKPVRRIRINILKQYCHCERSEAIAIYKYTIDCFVVPPTNDRISQSIYNVLFAFSNISAKRDSYHLAVLNRLVVIFCHTTWWAVSLGARNDDIFIQKWYIRKDFIINIINMFDTIDIMLNFAN